MTTLSPGDRVYFIQNGRKLRGVVGDSLEMKVRGEELLIPVTRPRNTKITHCHADHDVAPQIKTRWIKRSELRKLPDK